MVEVVHSHGPCVMEWLASLQGTVQRLQEELEGQQAMLAARQEGEALLKAEVARLAEENGRLKEEILEHQGTIMGLEEQVAEAGTASNVCLLCVHLGCVG